MARLKENLSKRLSKIKLDKEKIKKLYELGLTDQQIADFLGVTRMAVEKWKKLKELSLHLKDWKKEADIKVEKSLYQRALGYEYEETTTEYIKIGEQQLPAEKTKTVKKQMAPDVTACIFWLKNRQPQDWRDKTEIDHTMKEYLNEDYKDKSVEELERMADELRAKRLGRNIDRKGTGLQEKG
jgi:predicted transcriptional regulator